MGYSILGTLRNKNGDRMSWHVRHVHILVLILTTEDTPLLKTVVQWVRARPLGADRLESGLGSGTYVRLEQTTKVSSSSLICTTKFPWELKEVVNTQRLRQCLPLH